MSEKAGHRGYVASRPVRGQSWPQHVQNLVIRDYAQRAGLRYLLSATEFAMPGCYMNLEGVLEGIERLNGIVLFSVFMLPQRRQRRETLYARLFAAGADLHGALENIAVRDARDVERLEEIFAIDGIVAQAAGSV